MKGVAGPDNHIVTYPLVSDRDYVARASIAVEKATVPPEATRLRLKSPNSFPYTDPVTVRADLVAYLRPANK